MNDTELLGEYVQRQSESAFAELAGAHVDLSIPRLCEWFDRPLAEDITQAFYPSSQPTIRDGKALALAVSCHQHHPNRPFVPNHPPAVMRYHDMALSDNNLPLVNPRPVC